MKRLLGIIVAIAAVAGAYQYKYPTYTYRYRTTVAADAGGEVRSRSSVIEDLPKASGRRELAPDQMPTLITVTDPANAKTARALKFASIDGLPGKEVWINR